MGGGGGGVPKIRGTFEGVIGDILGYLGYVRIYKV